MKFSRALLEYYGVDPARVPDFEEFWALYATSFYEHLFEKIDDFDKLEKIYKHVLENRKLDKRAKEALTFFYNLRRDELTDPHFWDKMGMKKSIQENKKSPMKAKLVKESLNESMSRYSAIWLANNEKWYLDLAPNEYGEEEDADTYGPFSSEDAADKYLSDNFSNPGGGWVDDSGEKDPPTQAPNGSKIINPRSGGGGRIMMGGGYGRRW